MTKTVNTRRGYKNQMKIKLSIKPINKRTDGEPKACEGSFEKSLACILPVAVYYFLSVFLTYGAGYIIAGTNFGGKRTADFVTEHSMGVSAAIRIAVVIIAVLPLIPGLLGEKIILFQKKDCNYRNRLKRGICVVLLAGALAVFFNVLFSLTGLTSVSEDFGNTAAKQMAFPLSLGLLVYGLINPITEEIVFRGVVYNRLRRFYGFKIAVVAAPLLFGISHGNFVQLLYGFLMGVVLCLLYERLGSFIYVCLFHIVANSTVYIIMKSSSMKEAVGTVGVIVVTGIISLFTGILLFAERKTDVIPKEKTDMHTD